MRTIGGGRIENGYMLPLRSVGRSAAAVNRLDLEMLQRGLEDPKFAPLATILRNGIAARNVAIETERVEWLFPLLGEVRSVAAGLEKFKDSRLVRNLRCIPIGATSLSGDWLWLETVDLPNRGVFSWNAEWEDSPDEDYGAMIDFCKLGDDFAAFLGRIINEDFVVPEASANVDREFVRRAFHEI